MSSTSLTQALRTDFERVVESLGHVPTRGEYKEHGEYKLLKLLHHFSEQISYSEAVRTLGYDSPHDRGKGTILPEHVKQDFEHVVHNLGRVPTTGEYNEHGEYSAGTVGRKFSEEGSYPDAVRSLGYEPPNPNSTSPIPREELKHDIERVANDIGHIPGRTDYRHNGKYTPQTIAQRFDDTGLSFTRGLQNLGYEPYQSV